MMQSRLDLLVERWGASGIALTAAALPWERLQVVPTTELTLVRTGATITILAGIASWLKSRGASVPRTGLMPCIALFAIACLVSLPRSVDADATTTMIRVYGTYAAFFLSMATFVRTPRAALRLARVFAFSGIGVALISVLAASGLIWPVHWDTAFWAHQSLLQEFRDGQPMRITGAGLDFNQASLYLILGLAVVLFLPNGNRLFQLARFFLAALLVAAVALSMSRSGVIIAAGLVLTGLIVRTPGRFRIAAVAAAIAIVGVGAWLAGDFSAMFATRAQGGTVYDEGSARNRLEVYRVGLQLVPRFALTGAGLGASETAMRESEFAEDAVMAIHSMPLLLLIELGLLGLIAYGWLWWRVFRRGVQALLTANDADARHLGAAFGGMSAAAFTMLLVQPLMMLPVYPFLLGLGFGPAAESNDRNPPTRTAVSNGLLAATMLITFACVAENCVAFQRRATQTEAYADVMRGGLRAERMGRWEEAGAWYSRASELGSNLSMRPYFEEAAALIDLDPLYAELGAVSPTVPEAAALFADGRTYLARGGYEDAETICEQAWSLDPQFAFMALHLAEAYWASGNAQKAIAYYDFFAALPGDNGPIGRTRASIAFREDDASSNSLPLLLNRAAAARREGRWDDAIETARRIAAFDPSCAEAQYLLGVNAEITGESPDAFYRAALAADPNHRLARLALVRAND